MSRRKVSSEQNGESPAPRARKTTSAKMDSAVVAAPRARRTTRAKAEEIQVPESAERELASVIVDVQERRDRPTGVGLMSHLTDDVVRERAYLLAEQNGFAGDPAFYWRVAERELLAARA